MNHIIISIKEKPVPISRFPVVEYKGKPHRQVPFNFLEELRPDPVEERMIALEKKLRRQFYCGQ